jgi:hypothetical protein
MINVLERCLGGRGQVRPSAGNPPQLNNKVRICDCHNGGNGLCRRLLAKQST